MVSGLVVVSHEEELGSHLENKSKKKQREKGGSFHRLSLSIIITLSFSYESLSNLILDL